MTLVAEQITIGGIDVTDYILTGVNEDDLALEISKLDLDAKTSITDAVTLTSAQTIIYYRSWDGAFNDDDIIFKGKIELIKDDNFIYKITAYDMLNAAKVTKINRIFLSTDAEAGKISEIFTTIMGLCGLTADVTSVQDSGTMKTLSRFACRNSYGLERAKKLAQALGWRVYYRGDTDKVYFEPYKFTASAYAITSANLATKPNWSEDKSELANKITAVGANIQTQTQQTFAGSQTEVTLSYIPQSVKVTVSGVILIGGQQGTTGIDYYVVKDQRKIVFTVAKTDPVVDYSYASPLPLVATNPTSIATYGIYEKVITLLDVSAVSDLQQRLNNFLQTYSQPFQLASLEVKNTITNYGWRVGQTVNITDPYSGEIKNLAIRKITRRLRNYKDQLEFGDKEFRIEAWMATDLDVRIKKLEEEVVNEASYTSELTQIVHTLTPTRTTMSRTITRINDSFILGHPLNGALGRGIILENWEGGIGSWTSGDVTVSQSSTQARTGTYSMKAIAAGAGLKTINTTQSFGDLSSYSGTASGAPTTGTLGLWIYATTASDISAVTLKLGSDGSNYTSITGIKTYTNVFDLQSGWNYFVFRLSGGTTTGTPVWTATDYADIIVTVTGALTFYADYFTIGIGNIIALNGIGDRRTTYTVTT